MRTLSSTAMSAIAAATTTEIFIVLITITHESLAEPLRFSNTPITRHSTEPLVYKAVSRGQDYYFIPMEITLPDESEDSSPQAQIRLSNVGRELIELLRSVTTPPEFDLEIVLQSNMDIVEIVFPTLKMVSSQFDATTVSLSLSVGLGSAEPYPAYSFTPNAFPALF